MLNALIFDVDGTLADTESVHLEAFNHAFRQEGLDWHWSTEQYTQLLDISGGKERMLHHWRTVDPDMKEVDAGALTDTINRLHEIKTAYYENAVNSGAVTLRPGVLALMNEARGQGLQLAIATTTSPVNISALLRKAIGPDWMQYFRIVEDASTAPLKKPNPQVYLQTLERLGLSADACLAFEDSENGLRAAVGAKLATIVTPNSFTQDHNFQLATKVIPSLRGVDVQQLQAIHQSAIKARK